MSTRSKPCAVPVSLEERLRLQVRLLLSTLGGESTTKEIVEQVAILDELVTDFKRQDDLLERLLDPITSNRDLWLIIRQLPSSERLIESRTELKLVCDKSQKLIEQSVELINTAQRLVDESRDLKDRYAREICGFCKGFGGTRDRACPVCKDGRAVRVHQPPLTCPRCEGSGKATGLDRPLLSDERCVVCRGSGFAFSRQD